MEGSRRNNRSHAFMGEGLSQILCGYLPADRKADEGGIRSGDTITFTSSWDIGHLHRPGG
jgi:hypothetical protein